MKKEQGTLLKGSIINALVCILKIVGGLIFNSYTLIVSGYHTLSLLLTDVLALVGSLVEKKRADKRHPFGYGKEEYILQMVIGFVFLLIGIFIIGKSFFIAPLKPNTHIFFYLLLIMSLQVLCASYLFQKAKVISSPALVDSSTFNFLDVLSLIVVSLIVVLSIVNPQFDRLGSILMAIGILYEGLKIIFNNVVSIRGIDSNKKAIKSRVKEIIEEDLDLEYSDAFLIKFSDSYYLTVEMAVKDNVNIIQCLRKEMIIKSKIRRSLHIYFVTFRIIKD